METALPAANRLVISGSLNGASEVRRSPAGLPIARFLLDHQSMQREAGIAREARLHIVVLACGEDLAGKAALLDSGTPVQVVGFLSRANNRHGEARLVLHAESVELLDGSVHC
jgi:primosomal replication protein N